MVRRGRDEMEQETKSSCVGSVSLSSSRRRLPSQETWVGKHVVRPGRGWRTRGGELDGTEGRRSMRAGGRRDKFAS